MTRADLTADADHPPDNGRYLTVEEVRNRLDHMRGVLHGETGGGDGERAGSTASKGDVDDAR